MKKIYLLAAAAALFAACSNNDLTVKQSETPQLEEGAVGFDVYTQRATTRGGWTGSLTTEKLKDFSDATKAGYYGFGVFGYYTDNNEYDQRSTPNFFYNQQVQWNGSSWEYEPVKYWPNEYGDRAVSEEADKVTFFAYAPYIEVDPSTGKLKAATAVELKAAEQWGITGMTKNTLQGDPVIKYIASFDPAKSVDLCWGVADKASADAWRTIQAPTSSSTVTAGKPWIDLERPSQIDQRVKFNFQHATAQMKITIDADADIYGHSESESAIAQKTKVWIRSVKFTGFSMKGALNLNNEEENRPKWLDYNGQSELVSEEVIVYDGRKDDKEGVAGAVATNEKTLGLNPIFIQDGLYRDGTKKTALEEGNEVYTSGSGKAIHVYSLDNTTTGTERTGVTVATANLFETTSGNHFHVIPSPNEPFTIEIVYDIETVDKNLSQNLSDGITKGSSIENRISKSISFGSENYLQYGHSYTLALHLGMNSVKFDAAVTDWIAEPSQDVDLPANTPIFKWDDASWSATLPFNATSYDFAFTGMNGGESMKADNDQKVESVGGAAETDAASGWLEGWSTTTNNARPNGVALQTLTTKANPNTVDRQQLITYKNQDGIGKVFTFTQQAHPLFMKVTDASAVTNTITLTRYNSAMQIASDDWTNKFGWICDDKGLAITPASGTGTEFGLSATATNYIKVFRNNKQLTWVETAESGSKFEFANTGETDNITAKIKFGDALQLGDVIKVVIKTGDAPEETVTYVVPDIRESATIAITTAGTAVTPITSGTGSTAVSAPTVTLKVGEVEIADDDKKPTVTYSYTAKDSGNNDAYDKFTINEATGVVSTLDSTPDDTYTITVTATAAANSYYKFADPTATATPVNVTVPTPAP